MLTASALYQLPVGKGKALSFGGNRFANAVLGDWRLGGSLNFHTGLPINVLMTRNNVLYFNQATGKYSVSPVLSGGKPVTVAVINIPGGGQSRGTQRPDLVPGVDPYASTASGFVLNPAAFAVPQAGTYGDLARDALRGPGFVQLDTTVSKQFIVKERFKAELRGEIYNIMNHPNFANPTAAIGGASLLPGTVFTTANASSTFGQLSSTVGKYVNNGTNRQIQIALRFTF